MKIPDEVKVIVTVVPLWALIGWVMFLFVVRAFD